MVDVGTALLLLSNLSSDDDPIWVSVGNEEIQTTSYGLELSGNIEQHLPANQISIRFWGGTKAGPGKIKKGTLFTMLLDRITFG